MRFEDCPEQIGKEFELVGSDAPIFIMMVGLQGSGKTTLAYNIKDYFKYKYNVKIYVHSSDDLRKELFGSEDVQDRNNELFQEMNRRTRADLDKKRIVIYDATNVNKRKRATLLRELSYIKDLLKICVCIVASFEDCREHLDLRKNGVKVPFEVSVRTYRNWQPPHWSEGWDDIFVVRTKNYTEYIKNLYADARCMDQHNSHHKLSLGDHLQLTAKYMYDETRNYLLQSVALMHDLGKLHTVTHIDNDPEWHYYNHENVSAYLYMLIYGDTRGMNLIFWHMLPYNPGASKKLEKIKEEYGNAFYDDLILLHEADVAAH